MRKICFLSAVLSIVGFACNDSDDGLPAPSGLTILGMSSTQITLAWTDRSNGTLSTNVYRGDGANPSAFTLIGTSPAMLTAYVDNTVSAGNTYTYYVTATDGVSESSRSNKLTVKAEDPYVTIIAPTSSDTLTYGTYFTIEWQTNIPGFDARIYLSTNGSGSPDDDVLIRQSSPAGSTTFKWRVGYDWQGNPISGSWPNSNCVIRLHHYDQPSWSDESDTFTITQ